MPYQMSYETPEGVVHTASYWRIESITISWSPGRRLISLAVSGYHDFASIAAGKAKLSKPVHYRFNSVDHASLFSGLNLNNPLPALYTFIKTFIRPGESAPFFQGATDV